MPLHDEVGSTILSYASDPRIIKLLLDANAQLVSRPPSQDDVGDQRPALEAAVTNWVPKAVEMLIRAGARLNSAYLEGYVGRACSEDKVTDKIKVLRMLFDDQDKAAGVSRNKRGEIRESAVLTKKYIMCADPGTGRHATPTLLHVCAAMPFIDPSTGAVAKLLMKRYAWLRDYLFAGHAAVRQYAYLYGNDPLAGSVHELAMNSGNISVIREIAEFVKFPTYRRFMINITPGVVASRLRSLPHVRDCVEVIRLWADAGVDFTVCRTCVRDLVDADESYNRHTKDHATAIIIAEIAEAILVHPMDRNKRQRLQ
jgi:hypothetical protein